MKERKRFWKAGCIGPAMVLLGVTAFVFGGFTSFVVSILSIGPDGKFNSTGNDFWSHVAVAGLGLIAAGLFVMLFQSILWLVRKAGVAQREE